MLIDDAQSPDWAPDGRLAFASIRDRNDRRCDGHRCRYAAELYTAAADGSAQRRLTTNLGDDVAPAWSPDGSRILFTSDRSLPEHDSDEVYSIAADGSCLTWLTNGTPESGHATWRPASGDRYDPGSCDPSTRKALVDAPAPRPFRGALWLGRRHRGLLLSRVEPRSLSYLDCARFDPRECPPTVLIRSEAACRKRAFRGLGNAYRLLRRHGAIVAFYGNLAGARVLSGHAVTTLQVESGRLADVLRVTGSLRPYAASRPARKLAPPRVPERLARRLDRRDRSELRRALLSLGPYRISRPCHRP